jgi:hypothetical protein
MMGPVLFAVLAVFALACGSKADQVPAAEASGDQSAASKPVPIPAPKAAPQPVQHPDPSLPVSKRMLGKWRMDLDKVPDTALTEEFRKLKKQGKAGSLLITYTVTDTQFSMEAFGSSSIWRNRFDYEILRESGDGLLLKKTDEAGETSQVGVVLKDDDQLIIGTGNGAVPLQRLSLGAPALRGGASPEPKR